MHNRRARPHRRDALGNDVSRRDGDERLVATGPTAVEGDFKPSLAWRHGMRLSGARGFVEHGSRKGRVTKRGSDGVREPARDRVSSCALSMVGTMLGRQSGRVAAISLSCSTYERHADHWSFGDVGFFAFRKWQSRQKDWL
jgi:hypothetical protein